MKQRFTALALAAITAPASIGVFVIVTPGTAQASTPICTTEGSVNTVYGTIFPPATGSGSFNCDLYKGDDSSAVSALQEMMDDCEGQNVATDGDFGPATQAALKKVQAKVGVTADGNYGPQTRNAVKWPSLLPGDCYKYANFL